MKRPKPETPLGKRNPATGVNPRLFKMAPDWFLTLAKQLVREMEYGSLYTDTAEKLWTELVSRGCITDAPSAVEFTDSSAK